MVVVEAAAASGVPLGRFVEVFVVCVVVILEVWAVVVIDLEVLLTAVSVFVVVVFVVV